MQNLKMVIIEYVVLLLVGIFAYEAVNSFVVAVTTMVVVAFLGVAHYLDGRSKGFLAGYNEAINAIEKKLAR
jgi:hypothetical protein